MHIHLVYNASAGRGDHGEEQLRRLIARGGHDVEVLSPKYGRVDPQCELIAVAGGDGTVNKTIRHFCHTGIPLALIPLGTANNVAHSLGIASEPSIEVWPKGFSPQQTLSVGRVSSNDGLDACGHNHQRLFVESVGCGLVTQLIAQCDVSPKIQFADTLRQLRYRVGLARTMLQQLPPVQCELSIDGRDFSDRYLMVEVMNVERAGPALPLAPSADPTEDRFEVVLVKPEERAELSRFLAAVWRGEQPRDRFTRLSASNIALSCLASDVHVDDKALRSQDYRNFEIHAGACRVGVVN